MSYKLSFFKSDVVGAESSPNSVPPAANRIIRVPADEEGGYSALLFVGDGTSLVVTLWFHDAAVSGLWIPLNSPTTVLANVPTYIVVPSATDIFAQLGTNTGAVTKFGLGFMSIDAVAADASIGAPLPAGAATAAKQDTGNTSLSSLDTKQPSKGTAVMTGSSPVTIATDDTLMAAIKADVDKIPSKGTAVMTGSTPVTLATDDTLFSSFSAKFPTAAIPTDADVNTGAPATVTRMAARMWGFNGATWDASRVGLVGAQTTFVGLLNTIGMGRYNLVQPTLTDGQVLPVQLDVNGNLRMDEQFAGSYEDNGNAVAQVISKPLIGATYAAKVYANWAANVTKANVIATAANVYSVTITNRNAATRYFQLHNKATAPAGTDVPIVSFSVLAGASLLIGREFFGPAGLSFALGVGWAIGTTAATFTDSATASEHEVQITYIG